MHIVKNLHFDSLNNSVAICSPEKWESVKIRHFRFRRPFWISLPIFFNKRSACQTTTLWKNNEKYLWPRMLSVRHLVLKCWKKWKIGHFGFRRPFCISLPFLFFLKYIFTTTQLQKNNKKYLWSSFLSIIFFSFEKMELQVLVGPRLIALLSPKFYLQCAVKVPAQI